MKHIHESIIGRKGVGYQKYELTNETCKTYHGEILYRIKALKGIPLMKVKKGDLGGWIESYDNLDQKGDCWVADDAWVYGEAQVYDNAKIYGNAVVCDRAKVYGNAKVYGYAQIYGDAKVHGDAEVDYKVNSGKITK